MSNIMNHFGQSFSLILLHINRRRAEICCWKNIRLFIYFIVFSWISDCVSAVSDHTPSLPDDLAPRRTGPSRTGRAVARKRPPGRPVEPEGRTDYLPQRSRQNVNKNNNEEKNVLKTQVVLIKTEKCEKIWGFLVTELETLVQLKAPASALRSGVGGWGVAPLSYTAEMMTDAKHEDKVRQVQSCFKMFLTVKSSTREKHFYCFNSFYWTNN